MIPTDQPTPCTGNWAPFDVLIDARSHSPGWAIAEVGRMCGTCPVRVECWAENREEPWVKAIRKRPTQERPECGTVNGARAHHRRKEQTCAPCRAAEAERSRKRKAAADLAKTVQTFADIPEVVRMMHAEHVRLKARGEEIPEQIRAGESTYQSLRHKVRSAAKRAEAAA